MAFKSNNFYLENLDDKSYIGSNSNNSSNTISAASSSVALTYTDIQLDWPLAVDTTVVVVGHSSNVRSYYIDALFGGGSANGINIPIVANSLALDAGYIFAGNTASNVVYKYTKSGIAHKPISSVKANNISSFGTKLYTADGMLLVSAPNNYNNYGSVHVFDYGGAEKAILKPNSINQYTGFGYSVSAGNGVIVVGAPFDGDGKVYLYDYSFKLKKVIVAPTNYYNFGYSTAVGFSSIVVGAPANAFNFTLPGEMYIYDISGNLVNTLTSVVSPAGKIGSHVSIESNKAVTFNLGSAFDATNGFYAMDLRSNNISFGSLGYVDLSLGRVGMASANGNVYVTSDVAASPNKYIYTSSIRKRKHILEKDI